MNIFLMPTMQMLAMTEGAGGLFDFNATLPLMAIQFILLTVVLTFVFYKPVSKTIDERETYINDNYYSWKMNKDGNYEKKNGDSNSNRSQSDLINNL